MFLYLWDHHHQGVRTSNDIVYNIKKKLSRYIGLDGPGIESCWGEIFLTRPDRPWGSPSLLKNGYRVSFSVVKRPGCGFDHLPHLTPRLKKE
jgi:hypothetical protein